MVASSQGVRTPILQLSAMQEGDYTFQLTVTDSSGQQETAQVTVIVQPGKRLGGGTLLILPQQVREIYLVNQLLRTSQIYLPLSSLENSIINSH